MLIGNSIMDSIAGLVGPDARKVLIVHQPTLSALSAQLREGPLAGYEVLMAEIPDGEPAKRIEVAAFCWQIMGTADFTRTDVVIGFGGGAATDLAGFVAATWLRGVRVIQIPTTVLGMVDAAIGGKTAVNTSEGKNLVGTFYAPAAVVVDLEVLAGLDQMEILAGFGEVAKYGFIAEPEILEALEVDVESSNTRPAMWSPTGRALVRIRRASSGPISGNPVRGRFRLDDSPGDSSIRRELQVGGMVPRSASG